MEIINFNNTHLSAAADLALQNYQEERAAVAALPAVDSVPDLAQFADAGFGAAAFERGKMVGFLCFYTPWNHAFTTYAKGSFSPVHAHGTVPDGRTEIYRRMYQMAARKLVEAGATSHSIGIYAHDTQARNAFYTYGFGLRCMDAIRPMEPVSCHRCQGYLYAELEAARKTELLPLKNRMIVHLAESPAFMAYPLSGETELEETHRRRNARYFYAQKDGNIVAYLEITDRGENFACDDNAMKNICGAFCLPEHRGRGVFQNLLNTAIAALKAEGYSRLGVDFESFNPAAYGFWLKYFTAYTHGVVRRIDEKILERNRPPASGGEIGKTGAAR